MGKTKTTKESTKFLRKFRTTQRERAKEKVISGALTLPPDISEI